MGSFPSTQDDAPLWARAVDVAAVVLLAASGLWAAVLSIFAFVFLGTLAIEGPWDGEGLLAAAGVLTLLAVSWASLAALATQYGAPRSARHRVELARAAAIALNVGIFAIAGTAAIPSAFELPGLLLPARLAFVLSVYGSTALVIFMRRSLLAVGQEP